MSRIDIVCIGIFFLVFIIMWICTDRIFILVFLVFGTCGLIFALYIIFGIRINMTDHRKIFTNLLFWLEVKKIPTKTFAVGDEEHFETCCICQDDYATGDKLRILPCDHAYHVQCIDPWLKTNGACAQCRKKVLAVDERTPLLGRQVSVV